MTEKTKIHHIPFESRVDPNDPDLTATAHIHIEDGSTSIIGTYQGGVDERGRVIDENVRHLNRTIGKELGGQFAGISGLRDDAAKGIEAIRMHAAHFGPSSREAIAGEFGGQSPNIALFNSQGGAVFTQDEEVLKGDSDIHHVGIINAVDGIDDATAHEIADMMGWRSDDMTKARIMIRRFTHSSLVAPMKGGMGYALRSGYDNMLRLSGITNSGHLVAGFMRRGVRGYKDGAQALAESDIARSLVGFVMLGNTAVVGYGGLDTLHGGIADKLQRLQSTDEAAVIPAYALQIVEVPGQAHVNNAVNTAIIDPITGILVQQQQTGLWVPSRREHELSNR